MFEPCLLLEVQWSIRLLVMKISPQTHSLSENHENLLNEITHHADSDVDCHLFSFTLQYGGTALIWSSAYGHLKIAEMLIECGASLNVQARVSFRT